MENKTVLSSRRGDINQEIVSQYKDIVEFYSGYVKTLTQDIERHRETIAELKEENHLLNEKLAALELVVLGALLGDRDDLLV